MRLRFLLLSFLLALGAGVGSAAAQPVRPDWIMPQQGRAPDEYRGREQQQNIRQLREVVEELRARYGGDLISARLEQGGSPTYFIRWRMPDGDVRDFRVPAAR